MKKALPIIGAALALTLGFQSCIKSDKKTKVVNVGGLLSLSGNWSTLGIDSKAAMQLAADDINVYLKNKHADFMLSVSFYDTKLIADSARLDFINATSTGTHFIIGPQSSAELATIVPIAEPAQTIVISQGSTAGSLAIKGDPVYRFCPSDKVEGAAIANTIYNAGIKGLVTIARNDAGNLGLQVATGSSFIAKGGVINALDAYSDTAKDFTSVIAAIKAKVTTLSGTYGTAHTAVYLASFDEAALLFSQIGSDPVLSGVKWYGGDGVALSTILLASAPGDDFAVKTGFIAPSFGLPVAQQSRWQPIADRIKSATGIDPDAFALSAYDAMWVIAYSLEATNGNTGDFAYMKTLIMEKSNGYTGITGPATLDEFGDRAEGSFDYWGITKSGTEYNWTVVGKSE